MKKILAATSLLSVLCLMNLWAAGPAKDDTLFQEAIKQESFQVEATHSAQSNLHEASTLLVACIDFRLRDETIKLMEDALHLQNDYDEFVIPGASLALVQKKYPEWSKTLEDIVGLVEKLHKVKRVIFLDHYECGAYKLVRGPEHLKSKETDLAEHKIIFKEVREKMKAAYPHLEVYTLIMDLDGNVQNIGA